MMFGLSVLWGAATTIHKHEPLGGHRRRKADGICRTAKYSVLLIVDPVALSAQSTTPVPGLFDADIWEGSAISK